MHRAWLRAGRELFPVLTIAEAHEITRMDDEALGVHLAQQFHILTNAAFKRMAAPPGPPKEIRSLRPETKTRTRAL